jgi:hypothetical protein
MRRLTIDLAGISVYVESDSVHPIYEGLVSRAEKNAEDYPFASMKDLFMVAACVGAQQNRYKELTGPTRDIFRGEIFRKETDVPILAALAYHREKNLEILLDPRQIIKIAQGWANGGIHIVHQQIIGGPLNRPLYNLVDLVANQSIPLQD